MNRLEQTLQRAVVQLLELLYPPGKSLVLWFHTPQGGKRGGKRNRRGVPIEAAILKGMGTRAGVSDLVLLWGAGAACIELKAEGGRLSPAQRDFRDWCKLAGIRWSECRSLGEVEDVLRVLVYQDGMPEPEGWRLSRARGRANNPRAIRVL